MSFDYCVFHINSAHIYIDPKGRCPCKERQACFSLYEQIKVCNSIVANLSTI